MTIMSAQYAYRTGVQVSFVRDKNKKEAYFSNAFVIFSLSLILAVTALPRLGRRA
jgi:hypothetical protein